MNKKKKIITFLMVLLIPVSILIIKENITSKEEMYILSEEKNTQNSKIDNKEKDTTKKKENISSQEVTVYISGAVKTPGIVTLKKGDRLANAVEKVGGTTKSADLNKINMAIRIEDEQHYIIPKKGEAIDVSSNKGKEDNSKDKNNKESPKININKADIGELDDIPGVGEATANKIVNYRNDNGEFKSIEEIKDVNGIGDKKYEDMKDLICVE